MKSFRSNNIEFRIISIDEIEMSIGTELNNYLYLSAKEFNDLVYKINECKNTLMSNRVIESNKIKLQIQELQQQLKELEDV